MFHDIVEPSVRVGSRKPLLVPLSIGVHVAAVAAALTLSVVAPSALPVPASAVMAFVSRDIMLPPAPPVPRRPSAAPSQPVAHADPRTAPLHAPDTIEPERAIETVPPAPIGTVTGADTAPVLVAEPPQALPLPDPVATPSALRVGGEIRPPRKIKDVMPGYPAIAQAAKVEGLVVIEITIGADGVVTDAKVLRSAPLLDAAALDAVRQWEFTPTLLNGNPVPVIMAVTVRFALR